MKKTHVRGVLTLAAFSAILAGHTVQAEPNPTPGADVRLADLPVLRSGARAYPTPFLGVARTPTLIPPTPAVLSIQQNMGVLGGFAGFVDEATGQVGFPGANIFVTLRVSFDDEKLGFAVYYPNPHGRKTREDVTSPAGNLLADDVFEILIDPRDAQGRSRGPTYRVVGNARGVFRVDEDLPQIGQFHQPWQPAARYGTMKWDPMGIWMGYVQIPFAALGGPPADGEVWGVQCALRYADPKINAVLSPTDAFTDVRRFARVRFDRERRANYNAHWLAEGEIKAGTFVIGGVTSSGSNDSTPITLKVRLFKGATAFGGTNEDVVIKAREGYGDVPALRLGSSPASAAERDTVGRVTVTDNQFKQVIYDHFVPYWQATPGERDWLKTHFAKEFTFLTGPYPSKGLFDYSVDCQTLVEVITNANLLVLTVQRNGQAVLAETNNLPSNGKVEGTLSVGTMPDGARYDLTAAIRSTDGQTIASKTEHFTRHVMPFETAPKAGLSDIVVPPFTPPVVDRSAVSVWERTYRHGATGLLTGLVAAGTDVLARPVQFYVGATPLAGGRVTLTPKGKGMVNYAQQFTGAGVTLDVAGELDYDGFYKFNVTLNAQAPAASLNELRLEIPFRAANATLIETTRDYAGKVGDKCVGFLDAKPGRLWDSKEFPWQPQVRKGNMPAYVWVGDDDRGLVYSCASDQGMANDDAKPALAIDREGNTVVMRVWLVSRPLTLNGPRQFAFALQASPFKPMPDDFRLWRTSGRGNATYQKHGHFLHHGWGVGWYYPTYGRCLDLQKNKELLAPLQKEYDVICASASSVSECGGTPEYQQFWHEWGNGLGFDHMSPSPVPDNVLQMGLTNAFVMVESASNTSDANRDYRAWWLNEIVKHCGVSGLYQDNPPDLFYNQPAVGYGYTREDGAKEPTGSTWNQRTFMKRVATLMVENGVKQSSYVYPNLCGIAQPGRSFCRNALTGEYGDSDKLSLGAMRVWLSKQWGIQIGWLCQENGVGGTRAYWRALCSRLFLHDLTDFSRVDTADVSTRWFAALDIFWLDDPSVVWHPYYRSSILNATLRPSTLVSAYTAKGRALFVISNQGTSDTVEAVTFRKLDQYGAGGLKYFYDAETGEAIQSPEGALRLFIPANDYRLVLGFSTPWRFAAKQALALPDLQPQSTVDSRITITAMARQLLDRSTLKPVPGGHRLYEQCLARFVEAMQKDPAQFVYLDQKACAGLDIGDPAIRKALLFDKRCGALLVAYDNPTDADRVLPGNARAALTAKVGYQGWPYILDPVTGCSQWNVVDLPAHAGRLELITPDSPDVCGPRRGPYHLSTMLANAWDAVAARKAEMEPIAKEGIASAKP